ncbi:hypothetical protein HBF26_06585 [Luteibacter jiangsuensis]|uniref:Deaminase of polymorphic toxin system n=1 Tax=Luteibacter jiangsuensis TaxID=637577 RepID=A0ABX0Q3K9_9GAMM|nr:hypothetical protein [Luteibacter jiangsuensis]NID04544.1 hypothetical protein [Luteibacter jiangsuensis]
MNRHLHTMRAALAAFLLLASTCAAASGIEFLPGDANTKGILEEESRFHLQAFQNALQQPKHTAFVNDESLMRKLRDHSLRSTVARVEYRYNGARTPRVYHSRSGRSIAGTLRWIADSGASTGSDSTSGSEGSWAVDIEEDLAEQRFYPRLDANEVRVSARSQAGSRLRPLGRHGRDAEFKALRELEADLNRAIIPPGGELEIFVSQPPCASCTQAITQFSDTYKLRNTVVHHLTSTKDVPAARWSSSQKAYSEFFSGRRTLINGTLVTGKVRSATTRGESEALSLLEEAEGFQSGRLNAGKSACVP